MATLTVQAEAQGGPTSSPATEGRVAGASVIIPALNEACCITEAVESARACREAEVIVVDGGSADHTVEAAAAAGATILRSETGRATQMNAGACAARGDVLVFLHADTALPPGYAGVVREVLADEGVAVGAFTFRLSCRRWSLRIVERAVAVRSRWLSLPYGDQALFMRRSTFDALVGYRLLPIMEDVNLVRRARRLGRLRVVDDAATTSARRWEAHGPLRTTLVNQLCLFGYVLGASPTRLAAFRGRWLA